MLNIFFCYFSCLFTFLFRSIEKITGDFSHRADGNNSKIAPQVVEGFFPQLASRDFEK